jgi:DNA-binding transcriptional LysR family regulator
MLNPRRLRLLQELHALGTVRAVAAATRMSPSGVSAQLALLERETRIQLFERAGRQITLTPAGVALAKHATDILDHIGSVEAEMANRRSEPSGLIRISAFTSAIPSIVVPAALTLRRTHPMITVEVHESEPHASIAALQRSEVDIVVSADFADGSTPIDSGLLRIPLATDLLVLVASEDREDLGEQIVDLSTLASEPWAFEHPGTYLADFATRVCRQSGFEPNVLGRFVSFSALLQHVEAGLSITLLPRLAVDDHYRVRAIALANPMHRQIELLTKRTSPARIAVQETITAIRGAAENVSPIG